MAHQYNNEQQLMRNTYDVLNRTNESLNRANQVAYESEQTGTEILVGLGEQRESLLRSTRRLEDADEDLSQSAKIIRKLQRDFFYNKFILVSIIALELLILICLIIMKCMKF